MKILFITLTFMFGAYISKNLKLSLDDFKDDSLTYFVMIISGLWAYASETSHTLFQMFGINIAENFNDTIIESNIKGAISSLWGLFTVILVFFAKRGCELAWVKIKKIFKIK